MSSNSRIYLVNAADQVVCYLSQVRYETVTYTDNLMSYDTLEFTLDKYIDIDGVATLAPGYDSIREMMYVVITDINTTDTEDPYSNMHSGRGRFRIEDVTTNDDGVSETKTVSCSQAEVELSNQSLVGFRVNTGDVDSAEYLAPDNVDPVTGLAKNYVLFYDPSNPKLSLLNLLLEQVPYWSVGYVSDSLKNKKYSFDVDAEPVYSFIMNDLGQNAQAFFTFDTMNRRINAYSTAKSEKVGETGVVVGYRNLLNATSITKSNDGIYTRFNVSGADDLSIASVNFNEPYVEDLRYLLSEVDSNGDLIYATAALRDKYMTWYNYRYAKSGSDPSRREQFAEVSRRYNSALMAVGEIQNRVPNDIYDTNQYDGMDAETLAQLRQSCLNVMATMAHDYAQLDADGNVVVDSNGYPVILPSKQAEFEAQIYYSDYCAYRDIVVPNIVIAISNLDKPNADKTPYITSYEMDWDMYGVTELENRRNAYREVRDALSKGGYSKEWSQLTESQKAKYAQATYEIYHHQYVIASTQFATTTVSLNGVNSDGDVMYKDSLGYYFVRQNGTKYYLNTAKDHLWEVVEETRTRSGKALPGRRAELRTAKSDQSQADTERETMMADNAMTNSRFGFTSEELATIKRLYKDSDYVNENILTTQIDDVQTQISVMNELFDAAVAELEIESQPQYSLSADMDNLFNIEGFESWSHEVSSGRYIYVVLSDGVTIRMRVTSVTRNPCLDDDGALSVEFSNMVRDRNGLSDYTNLFQSAIQSSINQITANYAKNLDVSQIVLTDSVIKALANQTAMKSRVDGLIADQITARDGIFDVVQSRYIETQEFEARLARVEDLQADSAFIKTVYATNGIVDNMIIKDGHVTGDLVGVNITGDLIKAGTIVADKILFLGDDGFYQKINADGAKIVADKTPYTSQNSIHGNIIAAQQITANKIVVEDLSAFGATIGGWTLTEASMYSDAKSQLQSVQPGIYMGENGQLALGDGSRYLRYDGAAGTLVVKSDEFELSQSGKITATSVDLSGKITASSGKIGGWTLSDTALFNNTEYVDGVQYRAVVQAPDSPTLSSLAFALRHHSETSPDTWDNDFYVSYSGKLYANNAEISGTITSEDGKIGGWSVGPTQLQKSTSVTSGTASTQYNVRIYAPETIDPSTNLAFAVRNRSYDGSSYGDWNYKFYVRYDGRLRADDAVIKGDVTAQSGTIGGWTINDGALEQYTSNSLQYLSLAGGSMTSYTGYRVTPGSPLMLTKSLQVSQSNINIRGSIGTPGKTCYIDSEEITLGDDTQSVSRRYRSRLDQANFSIVSVAGDMGQLLATVDGITVDSGGSIGGSPLKAQLTSSGVVISGHSSAVGSMVSSSSSQTVNVPQTNSPMTQLTTIPVTAGSWLIRGACSWASNTSGARKLVIATQLKTSSGDDTSGQPSSGTRIAPASGATWQEATRTLTVTSDTTVYLLGAQNSGATLTAQSIDLVAIRIQ